MKIPIQNKILMYRHLTLQIINYLPLIDFKIIFKTHLSTKSLNEKNMIELRFYFGKLYSKQRLH